MCIAYRTIKVRELSKSDFDSLDFDSFKKVNAAHFIGIGGIGISAIARMMAMEGKEVSGSDRSKSLITDELIKFGAKVFIGHSAKNVPKICDLVIYTVAISKNNPELVKARKLKIPTLSYPEVLGVISKDKFTIAISGTHGKTTTTAMIGKMMADVGLDPTVIVGSLMNDTRSNIVVGKGKYFVVESCEYRRSFLNIQPKIIIITNIDNDHLDYYKNLKDIQNAFSEFVAKLRPDDYLITDARNKNILPVVKRADCNVVDYNLLGDWISKSPKLKLQVIGKHNLENAKAALALAKVLGISEKLAIKSLNSFSGTWRRFELKGKTKSGALVYDDYGHHPTEIKATLRGVREYFGDKKNIVTMFQPHLYSRTKMLLKDFATSFFDTDKLVLLPIYAAREKNDLSISSNILAGEIRKNIDKGKGYLKTVTVIKNKIEAVSLIEADTDSGVIITMGAGDVTEVSSLLVG